MQLSGKRVLVTGAAGGIGRALVLRFQEEGAYVIASDLDAPAEGTFPAGVKFVAWDCMDAEAVAPALREVAPDVVILNAGTTHSFLISEVSLEEWQRVMAVNLTGALLVAQAAVRYFRSRQISGSLVFVGSWTSMCPQPNIGAYGPSKAGLNMLAQCFARELAPEGIRVNTVSPGIIDTGMAARQMQIDPSRRTRAERVSLMGRLGEAVQVADACVFLASPRAGYVTGANLVVDGGASLGVN